MGCATPPVGWPLDKPHNGRLGTLQSGEHNHGDVARRSADRAIVGDMRALTEGPPSVPKIDLESLGPLDDDQRRAATTTQRPLVIIAPAGSGKTRVLTHCIAHDVNERRVAPGRVLAVTFTRKAAGELGSRLRKAGLGTGPTVGTFHALALAELRRWADDRRWELPQLLERRERVLGDFVPREALRTASQQIGWAKARCLSPSEYRTQAQPRPGLAPGQIARWYERYELEKRKRGLLDFDDLLIRLTEAINGDADFAAGQRWRFRAFYVDEFQDVTLTQLRLLQAWVGDRKQLVVVGDPGQAIFGWNGAEPEFLTRFDAWFPGATQVSLSRSHRSTREVLTVAAAVVDPARHSPAGLQLGQAPGTIPASAAHAPAGPVPQIAVYADDEAEASGVAEAVAASIRRGGRARDMAVLFRTNAQSDVLATALNRLRVPLHEPRMLLDHPAVTDALALLSDTVRSAPRVPLKHHLRETRELIGSAAERSVLAEVFDHAEWFVRVEGPTATLRGLEGSLRVAMSQDLVRVGESVTLTSFHRSKGLEWDHVWITGLENGLVPLRNDTDVRAAQEERNLCYVALTRARTDLHLSWAKRRKRANKWRRSEPSPYLDQIAVACDALALLERPAVPLPPQREPRPVTRDRRTIEATRSLKRWRTTKARLLNLPEESILPSGTLQRLAEELPADDRELAVVLADDSPRRQAFGAQLLDCLGSVQR